MLALAVSGNNTLTIPNSNSYTGGTTINGTAQIAIQNAAALGSGPVTVGDPLAVSPTLTLGNGVTFTNPLTITSGILGAGRGALNVAASTAATYNGTMTLAGSNVQTLTSAGTMTVQGTIGGSPAPTATLALRGTGLGFMQSTINIGSANVNKTDNGVWTISSSGNNWGNTSVAVGTLKLGASNALPSSTIVTLGQAGNFSQTWDLNGFNQTIGGLAFNTSNTAGVTTVTNSTATPDTLTINAIGSNSYGGQITGPLSLVITGTGSQTLSGTGNTFTGGVNVQGGTLVLGGSTALGPVSGALAVNGGTLDLAGASPTVGALSGLAGTITNSSGTLSTLTTSTSLSSVYSRRADRWKWHRRCSQQGGNWHAHAGRHEQLQRRHEYQRRPPRFFQHQRVPAFGNISINIGGALAVSGAYSAINDWKASGKISTASAGVLALVADDSETISMSPYGNLGIGATGSANFSGTLTPVASIYRLGGAGGTLTVSSALASGNALVVSGAGSSGMVILTNSGNNTFSSGITLASGGTLQGSSDSMQGNVANSGLLIFDQSDQGAFAGVISGSGSLIKQNIGLTNLTLNNTYSGSTTISGGTLELSGASSLAGSMTGVGTLLIGSGANASISTGGAAVTVGNIVLGSSAQLQIWSDVGGTSQVGNLIISGGTLVTRASTRNFYDNVSVQGDFQLNTPGNGNGFIFQGGQGEVFDLGGGTRTLPFDGGANAATFAGVIQNGGLIKSGTGTFVFNPTTPNTYTGGTDRQCGHTRPEPRKFHQQHRHHHRSFDHQCRRQGHGHGGQGNRFCQLRQR